MEIEDQEREIQLHREPIIYSSGSQYTAGNGIDINDENVISVDTDVVQEKLTAGDSITIEDNVISATDTTYNNFVGTDGMVAGTAGLVPAPLVADLDKYLKSDGTWSTVSGGGGEPDYSETEVSTGVKWIDGKTIYKKSYSKTIISNTQTFSLGITNLYEIVKIEAIWHAGGVLTNGMPTTISFPGDSSNNNSICILSYNNTAEINSNERTGMKGVITIYYTKSS